MNNISKINLKTLNTNRRSTGRKINLYYDKSRYKNIILKAYESQQILFILDNYGNWNLVEDYSGITGWVQKNKLKPLQSLYLVSTCKFESLNHITIEKNTKLLLINGKKIGDSIIFECLINGGFQRVVFSMKDAMEKLW